MTIDDEYTQRARELYERITDDDSSRDEEHDLSDIAAALRAAYRRGAEEMREQAKGACAEVARQYEGAAAGSRADRNWAAALVYTQQAGGAAECDARISALPTGPAAPAAEERSEAEKRGAQWALETAAEAVRMAGNDAAAALARVHLLRPHAVCETRWVRRGGGA